MEMQKIKKFKSEIAQFSQNKANFPPFFLLAFSSGGIPPPQIPPFLRRNTKYICYLFMNESSCLDNAHQKNKIQNGQGKVPA